MRCVVAAFVEEVAFRGGAPYCVLQVFVAIGCSRGIVMVCGGMNEDVAIEYSL